MAKFFARKTRIATKEMTVLIGLMSPGRKSNGRNGLTTNSEKIESQIDWIRILNRDKLDIKIESNISRRQG